MGQSYRFRAIIEQGRGGGAFVTVPLDMEQVFGKKRVLVNALIDGEPYRGSLVRMGSPCHILGILKEIRQKIGKTIGDEVEIILEEDAEPRQVVIPMDLAQALESVPIAAEAFKRLSYTHQKEYVQWIESAKREQTRQERVTKTLEMLQQ